MIVTDEKLHSVLESILATFEAHDAAVIKTIELCESLVALAIEQVLINEKKAKAEDALSDAERQDLECDEGVLPLKKREAFRDFSYTWLQYRASLRSLIEWKLRLKGRSDKFIQSELARIEKDDQEVWKKKTA